jgi:hypothetical protein
MSVCGDVGEVGDHGPRRPGGGLHLIVARRRHITTPTCSISRSLKRSLDNYESARGS